MTRQGLRKVWTLVLPVWLLLAGASVADEADAGPDAVGVVSLLDAKARSAQRTTAFAIDGHGHYLASSAAAYRAGSEFTLQPKAGVERPATLVAVDEDLGLAILKIEAPGPASPMIFAAERATREAAVKALYATGEGAVREVGGAVGAVVLRSDGRDGTVFLRHNAVVPVEGVGGALVNECGEVVGVDIVDPFLSPRRARKLPAAEVSMYAVTAEHAVAFLRAHGLAPQVASGRCLSAAERAAQAESEAESAQEQMKEVQGELARKQQEAEAARQAQIEAERLAQERARKAERLREDKEATEEERRAAEQAEDEARQHARIAAEKAAELSNAVDTLNSERDELLAQVETERRRQKWIAGAAGGLLLLVLTLAGWMLGRRGRLLRRSEDQRKEVEAKLAETFPDIECRGRDEAGAPHAFNIAGTALLREPMGVIVGRQPQSAQIVLNHPEISRAHARILLKDGEVFVEDLGTTNGSAINGQVLAPGERRALRSGDELTLGKITFKVRYFDE